MSLAPPKRPTPKPWGEMTEGEQADYRLELEVDELLDECQGIPPLEIAQGLISDPEEFGTAHSQALASCIRRRMTRQSLPPLKPTTPKSPPIKSRPVKLAKSKESSQPKAPTLL